MKSDYITRAIIFLKKVFPYIVNAADEDEIKENIEYFNLEYHRKVKVGSGLTRVALITSDYVIKFDFGDYSDIWEYGGCDVEYSTYLQAQKDGFAYLLAKTTPVPYKGNMFYIMPRIDHIGDWDRDIWGAVTPRECKWIRDHIADLHCENYGWKRNRPVIIDYAGRP
jgi:hypothetical protein